jgi:DNA-binding transcriptional MerR regulator
MHAASDERHLSPAETAQALGLSIKALRLYESRGLVRPKRTAAGWRVYGPDELASLHQVIALKRLGLPLARITELMAGRGLALDAVLALQEKALAEEGTRVDRALALVRSARTKLAHGEALSIDDLATLTTETTMATPSKQDWKDVFEPLIEKYFPPDKLAETTKRHFDQAKVTAEWNALIAEANQAMAKGDPSTPEALDIARRWNALVEQFTKGDPVLFDGARKVWDDAMADPRNAGKFPVSPALFTFVGKAMAKLKGK